MIGAPRAVFQLPSRQKKRSSATTPGRHRLTAADRIPASSGVALTVVVAIGSNEPSEKG